MLAAVLRWTGNDVPGQLTAGLRRRGAATLLALLALAAQAALAAAAAAPDYGLLEEVLLQNVRNGYVDYDGIAAQPKFARFVAELETAPPPAGRNAALAYYVNAYNALAIQGVLQGPAPATASSLRRLATSTRFILGGEKLTLGDIEKQRLLPLAEPRTHFALACAALACARLSSHAYLAETLDAQLDEAARRFVNDVTRNRFDIAQRTAFVSPLFAAHRAEFEAAAGSLPAWLARYVDEPASRAALLEGRLALRYLDPDWELNGGYARGSAN